MKSVESVRFHHSGMGWAGVGVGGLDWWDSTSHEMPRRLFAVNRATVLDSFKFKGHPTAVFNDPNEMGSPKNPGYYDGKYADLHKDVIATVMKMGHPATGGTLRKNIDKGAFTRSWQTWIAPVTETWNMGTYYNGEQMAISMRSEVTYHTWWRHEGRFATAIGLEKESIDPARDSEVNIVGAEPPTAKDANKRLESCSGV